MRVAVPPLAWALCFGLLLACVAPPPPDIPSPGRGSRVHVVRRGETLWRISRHYGLEFEHRGSAYACCSPFTEDRTPSFFVRVVKGQWLFKDFSSGAGGTILDFVWMKERLGTFSEALRFVRALDEDGTVPIPGEPGMGYRINWDYIQEHRIRA